MERSGRRELVKIKLLHIPFPAVYLHSATSWGNPITNIINHFTTSRISSLEAKKSWSEQLLAPTVFSCSLPPVMRREKVSILLNGVLCSTQQALALTLTEFQSHIPDDDLALLDLT
jgi:hypothetical protein